MFLLPPYMSTNNTFYLNLIYSIYRHEMQLHMLPPLSSGSYQGADSHTGPDHSNMLLIFTSLILPLCFYALQYSYSNRELLLNSLLRERLSMDGRQSNYTLLARSGSSRLEGGASLRHLH